VEKKICRRFVGRFDIIYFLGGEVKKWKKQLGKVKKWKKRSVEAARA
jgi:hypothetical protein